MGRYSDSDSEKKKRKKKKKKRSMSRLVSILLVITENLLFFCAFSSNQSSFALSKIQAEN